MNKNGAQTYWLLNTQINIDLWKHQVDESMQHIEGTLEKWSNGLGSEFKFYFSIGSVISSGK